MREAVKGEMRALLRKSEIRSPPEEDGKLRQDKRGDELPQSCQRAHSGRLTWTARPYVRRASAHGKVDNEAESCCRETSHRHDTPR